MSELSTIEAVEAIASNIFTRKDPKFIEDITKDIRNLDYVLKDLLDANSYIAIRYKLETIRDKVAKNEVDMMLDLFALASFGEKQDG